MDFASRARAAEDWEKVKKDYCKGICGAPATF